MDEVFHLLLHHLRSPVASISTLVEVYQSIEDDLDLDQKNDSAAGGQEDLPDLLSNLKTATSRMTSTLEVINQIHTIYSKTDIQFDTMDLHTIISGTEKSWAEKLAACNAKVIIKNSPSIDLHFPVPWLHEILNIFMTNAIQFRSPDRPLEIEISWARQKDQTVEFHFKDNGVGVDIEKNAAKWGKLFKTFHKGLSGMGSSIYVAHAMLEKCKATMKATSAPDAGLTWHVIFAA